MNGILRTALLSGLIFWSLEVFSQLSGTVVSISDGDTFTLLVNKKPVKVRLHGIDCPEKKQAFGKVASTFLGEHIFNRVVEVHVKGKDRYGRTIGIVYDKGEVINEKMLEAGLAWHYTKYDTNSAWAQLEAVARKKRVGLWAQDHPLPPWDFRKQKKKDVR